MRNRLIKRPYSALIQLHLVDIEFELMEETKKVLSRNAEETQAPAFTELRDLVNSGEKIEFVDSWVYDARLIDICEREIDMKVGDKKFTIKLSKECLLRLWDLHIKNNIPYEYTD